MTRRSGPPRRSGKPLDRSTPDLTRRGLVRSLAAASLPAAAASGSLPAVGATEDDRTADLAQSGTLRNDSLAVYVATDGTYEMATADGQQLTYPSAGTSGLTIRVDGTNYVVGTPPGESLSEYRTESTVDESAGVATVRWELPEGVGVTLEISLSGPATRFDLSVSNEDSSAHEVGARFLFDYQVGPQDGAPIFANGEVITNETRFESPPFESWQTYDRLPDPSLTGRGTLGTTPDRIEFVAWEDASGTGYEYGGFDPEKEFFTPGSTSSPESDSAGLLYFEFGSLSAGGSDAATTYYGVGEPLQSDVDQLDQALVDYRDAVTDYLDRVVRAKAEGYARQYLREEVDGAYGLQESDDRSYAFRSSIVTFFEYRAGTVGEGATYEPHLDDIRSLDDAIGDDLSTDRADAIATFADEAFAAVPEGEPDEVEAEAIDTFEAHLLGEGEEQEHTLTVGGSTLAELRESFVTSFDERRETFVAACRSDDVGPETVDAIVRQIDHHTERIASLGASKAENYREIVGRAVEGEQVASTADTMKLGGAIGGAVGGTVGLGAGLLLAGPTGEEPILIGIGTSVGSTVGTTVGGLVAPVLTDGQVGGNRWSRSFVGTETWTAIASFELQWLYNLATAPERVLPGALVNAAGEDLDARVTTAPETMFDAGCRGTAQRVGLDVAIEGVRTDNVTEESRLGESALAGGDGTVTIRNPESNGQPIVPSFLREECMVVPHTTAAESGHGYVTLPPRSDLPRIAPGETADVPFGYVTPYRSNADFELQFRVRASPVSRPVESGIGFVSHQVGTAAAVDTESVSSGTLDEGESRGGSTETGDATQSEVSLVYGGSDLDLHLYDGAGNHVGQNYQTGEFETQIDSVEVSGPDGGTGFESIRIEDPPATLQSRAVAVSTPTRGSGFSVTSVSSGDLPPSPATAESDVAVSGTPGDTVETSITLRETAGDAPLDDLSVEASALSREDSSGGDAGFAVEADAGDTVPPGESEAVDLAVEIPGGVGGGRYVGDLTVAAAGQELTLPLEVAVSASGGLPDWLPYAGGAAVIGGAGALGYRYLSSRGGPAAGAGGQRPPAGGQPGGPQGQAPPQGGGQPPQDASQPPRGAGQSARDAGQPPQGGSGAAEPGTRQPQGSSEGEGVATVSCPNCGASNLAGSAVCGTCGHQFQ